MTNNNKIFNEIYRDFSGMAKSKSISDIAKWLEDHEGYELINRDEIGITFNFEKYDLVVCITNSGSVNIKDDDDIYDMLADTSFLDF